uniref:helix-turn-helix domain-containing protein n=1 Tax=uncultured Draconibacterium sp. TaxID=1573823 RepID=UPI003217C63A
MDKKGLSYLYIVFLLKAIHVLPPVLVLFHVNINYSAYITAPIKVSLLPLYYLYLLKLGEKHKKLQLKELWHFVPMFIELIISLIIAPRHADEVIGGINFMNQSYMELQIDNNFYYNLLSISAKTFGFLQAILYSVLIYKFIFKKYQFKMKNHTSNIGYNSLNWIKSAAIVFAVECLLLGVDLFGIYMNQYLFGLTYLYLIFFGFYFFVHSILQPDLSYLDEDVSEVNQSDSTEKEITNEDNCEETTQFLNQFSAQKLYLMPDLTLLKVSEKLDMPCYRITAIIKKSEYKNFYDLVNRHRVEFSIGLLGSLPSNYSLDSVGIDSGFNSRSTFYRVFKQETGYNPGNYYKILQEKS